MWKNLCIGVEKGNSPMEYINIDFEKPDDMYGFCNVMADYIIDKYEEKLVNKIILNNYYYLTLEERKQILNKVLNLASDNAHGSSSVKRRKKIIVDKLMEYITSSNFMVLKGFVLFRIPEYMHELDELVDEAVESLVTQREYNKFIELLRYFVQIQEPEMQTLHILPQKDSSYKILDEDNNELGETMLTDFMNELSDEKINDDDLLISSLISIAPSAIVIHNIDLIKNVELVRTIKNVFLDKVKLCSDCNLCKADRYV